MAVPFLDLKAQYESIKDEIHHSVQKVFESRTFAGGPFVAEFEKAFAAYCGTKHAIGVASGTDAIWAVLMAIGIGPGDEVITVPNTFMATAEAITFSGAKPVFVDIDERTYNINPEFIKHAITPRTKAIIPVHLYGQTADMDPIIKIAAKYNLHIIEDACQAHGAEYKGKSAGSMGIAGCFSFYPAKNLGAYGEAGAIVTNNSDLAEKLYTFRDHGQKKKYYHSVVGWNARMDGLQGAALSVKLRYLNAWNNARRKNARLYNALLANVNGITTPAEAIYAKHIYHIYAVRAANRDALMSTLAEKEIYCGIHYPIPIHMQDAYRFLGYKKGSFPVAEKCADEQLSLPMFPEISREQIKRVSDEIKAFYISTSNSLVAYQANAL
jgi:dTDP-4-amino-4,6-dideoxygalactose transaminase